MGWAGGSEVASDVWKLVRPHIPAAKRRAVAKKLIKVFENQDCDTMEEAELLWKDAGMPNPWGDDE